MMWQLHHEYSSYVTILTSIVVYIRIGVYKLNGFRGELFALTDVAQQVVRNAEACESESAVNTNVPKELP